MAVAQAEALAVEKTATVVEGAVAWVEASSAATVALAALAAAEVATAALAARVAEISAANDCTRSGWCHSPWPAPTFPRVSTPSTRSSAHLQGTQPCCS